MVSGILWRRFSLLLGVVAATVAAGIQPASALSTTVTISQVYGGGETTSAAVPPAPYKNDFIELYNKSEAAVDLSTWSVQYASSTGASWSVAKLTGSIAPGGYYLVAGHTTAGSQGVALPTPDFASSLSLSATAGKVALVNSQTALTGATPTGSSIVDFVGYGAANWYETKAINAGQNQATAAIRLDGGCVDRDDNAIDFVVEIPTPRNTATPVTSPCPQTPPGVLSVAVSGGVDPKQPTRFDPGATFTLTANVLPGSGPITTVTADLRAIAGEQAVALTNGGTGNVYTLSAPVPASAKAGFQSIVVTATDANGRAASGSAQLIVNYVGGVLTVGDALRLPLNSIFKVRGICVNDSDGNPYLQDPDSANTNNAGCLIFDGRTLDGAYPAKVGDDVTVTCYLGSYGNEYELVPLAPPADIVVNSSGNPIQAPKVLTIPDVTGNETYAGQLVTIKHLTVVNLNDSTNPATATISGAGATGFGGNSAPTITLQDDSGNQIGLYIHRNAAFGAFGSDTANANLDPGFISPANNGTPAGYPGLTSSRVYLPHDPIPSIATPTVQGGGSAAKVTFNYATINNGGVQTETLYDIKVGNIFDVTGSLGERTPPAPVKMLRPRWGDDLVFRGVNVIIGASATGGSPKSSQFEQGMAAHLSVLTYPATGSTVTADLSNFGGTAATPMPYVAANNDYELDVTLPANAPLGFVNVPITAANSGNPLGTANGQVGLLITTPVDSTIDTIRKFRDAPWYTKASLTGTVTANTTNSTLAYQIQDATGGVLAFSDPPAGLANVGDSFTVTGYKDIYNGFTECQYQGVQPYIAEGTPVDPQYVSIANYTPDVWGDLVKTTVQVVAYAPGASSGSAYTVVDATGKTAELYIHLNTLVFDQTMLLPGANFDITGIVDYFNDSARNTMRLKPRGPYDIVPAAVNPIIPAKLAITTQPVGAQQGAALSVQPVVTVQDVNGATATGFTGTVTFSIKPGTGAVGASLLGTQTVDVVNGIATFAGLAIDKAALGYVLTATSGSLTPADSAAFNVTLAAGANGDINGDGSLTTADAVMALQIAGGLLAGNEPGVNLAQGDVFPKGAPDGSITLEDALRILRAVDGLDSLP